MRAYLDMIEIPKENMTPSLIKPVITQQRIDETGDRSFAFTGDLEFIEEQYQYLYDKLVTDPNRFENRIVLTLIDDCCSQNLKYEFWITYKTIKFCEGVCLITASAEEKSDSVDQYTCFKNTIIWDNHNNFQDIAHPRMAYCNELRPNWLHDILMILIIATWTSFLVFGPLLILVATIITIINAVISAINSLGGSLDPIDLDGDDSTNAYDELNNWVNQLINQSFGCGRKHPSPLVRDYVNNVCQKCGVNFSSSIYNDSNSDYYNTVYVNAPINKGTQESDISTYWIAENAPILSGLQLLDQLAPVTNSKFQIKNNTLYFERRDFFVPTTPWFDATVNPQYLASPVCYEYDETPRPAYANLRYQKDGINWVGSEAVARWSDIVEWNNPYSPMQSGEYVPLIQFASCRFRDDGIDRDVLTFYENLPTVGPLIKKYKNAMLMNSHNCFTPMLLIWDGQDRENASCDKFVNINYPGLAGVVGANQYYNFPFWFKAGYPGNLYDRFHAIENPRVTNRQAIAFTMEVKYDCNLLSLIDIDGTVKTPRGISKDQLIVTIDRVKGILIIKGKL